MSHTEKFGPVVAMLACMLTSMVAFAESSTPGAQQLWEQRCGVCHSLNPPPKIGPPVRGIVMHYRSTHQTREAFVNAVSSWVTHPQKERSLIPQAIEKFGIMPPLAYDAGELRQIAGWMWDQAQ